MFNINHIAISVKDNIRSIEFYQKFCFKKYKSFKTAQNVSTDLPVIGTKHFALGVKNIEEVKEFVLKNNICQEVDINVKTFFLYYR